MELPDAAAEGGCADNLKVEWNTKKKKKKEKEKSNQWSILKDHKRNCLSPFYLVNHQSIYG